MNAPSPPPRAATPRPRVSAESGDLASTINLLLGVAAATVTDVRDPKSGIATAKRFAVEAGKPGAVAG